METDVGEFFLSQSQSVRGVGQKDLASVFVECHVVEFPFPEVVHLGGVVGFYPTGLVDLDGLVPADRTVFVFETVLDHFELQGSDRTDDLTSVQPAGKELGNPFVHQLVDAFGELFEFHRIAVLDVPEQLGGETGNTDELQRFTFGKGVSDLEISGVVQAYDVTRERFVDDRFLFGHECGGGGEFDAFPGTDVQVGLVPFEPSGADLQESDPVAVVRVHVRMNLEDKAGQLGLVGVDVALYGVRRSGRRGDPDEAVQQFADTEVVQCTAEKDGSDLPLPVALQIERRVDSLDQFEVIAQLLCEGCDVLVDGGIVQPDVDLFALGGLLVLGKEERKAVSIEVVNALESRAGADGPGEWTDLDLQLLFDLIQQVERVLARTVELVDEDHYRGVAHPAHLHQLSGLRLDAFGSVDHDDDAVDRRQGPVGVFGEVFVPGRVEDVDLDILVLEAHDRRGDRDSPLSFDLHEVRSRTAFDLVRFDGSGHVYGSAEQQQLFR